MNFYEDGTPCGFGLLKTAAVPGFIGKAMGAGSKMLNNMSMGTAPGFIGKAMGAGSKMLNSVGQGAAKMVGTGGKALQRATANGKLAQQGKELGGMMRNVGGWVNKGNNAAKLGGAVVGAGAAGTLLAGGLANKAARSMNGGNQQPEQQNKQQTW